MKIPVALFTFLLCMQYFPPAAMAQQMPASVYQQFAQNPDNPAAPLETKVNHTFFAVQHRSSHGSGFRSMSQFLNFRGKPQGKKGAFRWGVNLLNDIEHTEHRLSIGITAAAKVWHSTTSELNLGLQGGLILWNSNYEDRAVYNPDDPLAADRLNLIEVNTGIGAGFRHRSKSFWFDVAGSVKQLSGNLITSPLEGIRLFPGLHLETTMLFAAGENLKAGPRVGFRQVLGKAIDMGPGKLDLGFRAALPGRTLWAAGSFRPEGKVVSLGFGFPILMENKTQDKTAYQNQLNLNFGVLYPAGINRTFGPTVEVGLSWTFGRELRNGEEALPFAKPFWLDEPTLVTHKQDYLDHAGPRGLGALAEIYPKNVFLTYQWLDQSLLFCGENPRMTATGLQRAGMEWDGVDAIMQGLVYNVVEDALYPDSSLVRDPENLESLRHLAWIEVSCGMRDNAYSASYGSNMTYQGEFSLPGTSGDSLLIPVVYDEKDTIIHIPMHQHLSNLELAALKAYALSSRLVYELNRKFGDVFRILKEEDVKARQWDPEVMLDTWHIPIIVRTPRITTDHANLQAFQLNKVRMKFPRRPENYSESEDIWIPRENSDETEQTPLPTNKK